MNLFDGDVTPDDAARRLGYFLSDSTAIKLPAPLFILESIRVLAEDRERLLALAAQARQVRQCQKRYFADRLTESLTTSKEAERKLDGMLKE